MAETKSLTFSYKELAGILIKDQKLHEGLWGVIFEFGLAGGLFAFPPGGDVVVPTAMIPIVKVGIQRFDEANPITVDAAQVNPATNA